MDSKTFSNSDLLQCLIARHYESVLGASVVSVGFAPKWDIKFKDTTLEVKLDATAAKTLNAAIEYWDLRRNKPTGILETEASRWIHCVPESNGLRCYELEVKRLQRLCMETGQVKTGGDNESSVMKIIPMQKIREISVNDFFLDGKVINLVKYW